MMMLTADRLSRFADQFLPVAFEYDTTCRWFRGHTVLADYQDQGRLRGGASRARGWTACRPGLPTAPAKTPCCWPARRAGQGTVSAGP